MIGNKKKHLYKSYFELYQRHAKSSIGCTFCPQSIVTNDETFKIKSPWLFPPKDIINLFITVHKTQSKLSTSTTKEYEANVFTSPMQKLSFTISLSFCYITIGLSDGRNNS